MNIEDTKIIVDIIKIKLLVYSAGVAGCWAFISEHYGDIDFLVISSSALILCFTIGVSNNLYKLGQIENSQRKKDG